MAKIPFIEKRVVYDYKISKLFNLIVNYYQLNRPEKVGMCTKIYTEYFRNTTDVSLKGAVGYYFDHKKGLKEILKNHSEIMEQETLNFLVDIKEELKKDNNIFSKLYYKGNIDRNKQYQSPMLKAYSLFFKDNRDVTISLLKKWIEEIFKEFSIDYIRKESKQYFFQLLTIESIIGTSIENDILKDYATKYEVYKSSNILEKEDIDGIINGNFISIKSIKYKTSHYAATAARKISDKSIIIEYKIQGNEYIIENKKEVDRLLIKKGIENTNGLRRV